jgi:probable phosphoglycerate mutase
LLELDFGEWTGKTYEAVREDERWRLWSNCRSIAMVPGGESMRQVQERAVGALFELRQSHRDGTVLVVSHGDVIRAALLFALGMPLDLYSRIEVALASTNTIHIDDSGIRVLGMNERPRLSRT